MKVIKFGGAIFTRKEAFQNFKEILDVQDEQILVVISAFGKITSKLKRTAILAESANAGYIDIIDEIDSFYSHLSEQVFTNIESKQKYKEFFDKDLAYLRKILKGIEITTDLSYRTMDMVLSFGESLALEFLYLFLRENKIDSKKLDSRDIIITDCNFGKAKPDINETGNRLKKAIENEENINCFIIQGFVGATIDNIVSTMGMESSNLTAIICADI